LNADELFLNEAFIKNPYPFYKDLRSQSKPLWLKAEPEIKTEGTWVFSKYRDVYEVLRQTENISKDINQVREEENKSIFDLNLLNMNGLKHAEHRKLLMQYFSAGKIELILPLLNAKIEELMSGMLKNKEFNFVSEFAEPLPIYVIGLIIGLPFDDLKIFRKKFSEFLNSLDSFQAKNNNSYYKRIEFIKSFKIYLKNIIAQKKIVEGSLLADLLWQQSKGTLSEDELIGMIFFLFFAGHETTINLINSLFYLLKNNPNQLEILKKNQKLISFAIDEALRYESPLQRSSFRLAKNTVNINGFTIQKNQQMIALIGSANRDETVFTDPDIFDITRQNNPHLAFGFGIHNCFGRLLASTEARLAILALINSDFNFDLYECTPLWKKNSLVRSLDSLICRYI
jgi:pimeloyl-[acyl-carrier protein] synthase